MVSSTSLEGRESKLHEISGDEVEEDEDKYEDHLLASILLEDATSLSDHHVCRTASDPEVELNLLDATSCLGG